MGAYMIFAVPAGQCVGRSEGWSYPESGRRAQDRGVSSSEDLVPKILEKIHGEMRELRKDTKGWKPTWASNPRGARLDGAKPQRPTPNTHLWAAADGQFVGRLAIHHELSDALPL